MKKLVIGAMLALLSGEAYASQAAGWYLGRWSCTIDGRAAQMLWEVRDDSRQTCSGGTCTRTSGVKVLGWFWDRNGPWAQLRKRSASANTLTMYHADGNLWSLRYANNRADGFTTWQGKRYPLTCTKRA